MTILLGFFFIGLVPSFFDKVDLCNTNCKAED